MYRGPFGRAQAERLLWRAGFGPAPGQAEEVARQGLRGAVLSLTRSRGAAKLSGAPPHDGDRNPLAPTDAWGHDHLWWLDRMVRTDQPLVERMTLVWHDWFATSNDGVGSERLMLAQNRLLRRHALGNFRTLLLEVTRDPAMLLWLSGTQNNKWSPNENYARELMELFTLGAKRGYTERDVRQQARALTGFRNEWREGVGAHRFRYDKEFHDTGRKRIFGRSGRFDWRDACELCLRHRNHPSFVVRKLWSYFIPTPPSASDQRRLEALYRRSGLAIRPLVEAILMHPALHSGPRMVKPPVVYVAGLLRAQRAGVETDAWSWLSTLSGQKLFYPPNVAGWDDTRWIDTSTFRGRWMSANYSLQGRELDPSDRQVVDSYPKNETPQEAVERALAYWGNPSITDTTRGELLDFSRRVETAMAAEKWKRRTHPVLRQNALRALVATCPELMTS